MLCILGEPERGAMSQGSPRGTGEGSPNLADGGDDDDVFVGYVAQEGDPDLSTIEMYMASFHQVVQDGAMTRLAAQGVQVKFAGCNLKPTDIICKVPADSDAVMSEVDGICNFKGFEEDLRINLFRQLANDGEVHVWITGENVTVKVADKPSERKRRRSSRSAVRDKEYSVGDFLLLTTTSVAPVPVPDDTIPYGFWARIIGLVVIVPADWRPEAAVEQQRGKGLGVEDIIIIAFMDSPLVKTTPKDDDVYTRLRDKVDPKKSYSALFPVVRPPVPLRASISRAPLTFPISLLHAQVLLGDTQMKGDVSVPDFPSVQHVVTQAEYLDAESNKADVVDWRTHQFSLAHAAYYSFDEAHLAVTDFLLTAEFMRMMDLPRLFDEHVPNDEEEFDPANYPSDPSWINLELLPYFTTYGHDEYSMIFTFGKSEFLQNKMKDTKYMPLICNDLEAAPFEQQGPGAKAKQPKGGKKATAKKPPVQADAEEEEGIVSEEEEGESKKFKGVSVRAGTMTIDAFAQVARRAADCFKAGGPTKEAWIESKGTFFIEDVLMIENSEASDKFFQPNEKWEFNPGGKGKKQLEKLHDGKARLWLLTTAFGNNKAKYSKWYKQVTQAPPPKLADDDDDDDDNEPSVEHGGSSAGGSAQRPRRAGGGKALASGRNGNTNAKNVQVDVDKLVRTNETLVDANKKLSSTLAGLQDALKTAQDELKTARAGNAGPNARGIDEKLNKLLEKTSGDAKDAEKCRGILDNMKNKIFTHVISIVVSHKPSVDQLVQHLKILHDAMGYVPSGNDLNSLSLLGALDAEALKQAYASLKIE